LVSTSTLVKSNPVFAFLNETISAIESTAHNLNKDEEQMEQLAKIAEQMQGMPEKKMTLSQNIALKLL